MSASQRFTAPPPPGVDCDCWKSCLCDNWNACDHEREHWHQRLMGASCDSCISTKPIEADVFCYTRDDALRAIAQIATDAGWPVTDAGCYRCPACTARMGRVVGMLSPT